MLPDRQRQEPGGDGRIDENFKQPGALRAPPIAVMRGLDPRIHPERASLK
jgi:hypothetical protein